MIVAGIYPKKSAKARPPRFQRAQRTDEVCAAGPVAAINVTGKLAGLRLEGTARRTAWDSSISPSETRPVDKWSSPFGERVKERRWH